jgi:hydrogenase expression/formation protein HypE
LDPLTVANEGKVVAFVPPEEADRALEIWRGISPDATHIGAAVKRGGVAVSLVTRHGGRRIVEMPYGEDLPRIC